MKIFYDGGYYKILDVPNTYEGLIIMLPKVCRLQDLPPKYRLHYVDHEKFPINLACEYHYQVMLKEMKDMTEEIIVILTSDLEKDIEQNLSMRDNLSMKQSSWIQTKAEAVNESSRFPVFNSPRTTYEESSMGNDIENNLKSYDVSGQSSSLVERKESPKKTNIKIEYDTTILQNLNEKKPETLFSVEFYIKDPKSGEMKLINEEYIEEAKERLLQANEKKPKKSLEKGRQKNSGIDNEKSEELGDKVVDFQFIIHW